MKKKKTASIVVFLLVLFVVPLLAKPELLTNAIVLYSALICALLLGTQPLMSAKDGRANQSTDRGTMLMIIIISASGQLICILDWAYFQSTPADISIWRITGALLMAGGLAFRVWAIRTLKTAFSATVQIKENQQLITSGPYHLLRHPSYTGSWVLMIGVALLFESWAGMLLLGPGMLFVYSIRISTEEDTLEKAFGSAYSDYKQRTHKIIPKVY